jgi:hypothetical protein
MSLTSEAFNARKWEGLERIFELIGHLPEPGRDRYWSSIQYTEEQQMQDIEDILQRVEEYREVLMDAVVTMPKDDQERLFAELRHLEAAVDHLASRYRRRLDFTRDMSGLVNRLRHDVYEHGRPT